MKLTIRKMPVVAPRGTHNARITGFRMVQKSADGELCNHLVADIELVGTTGPDNAAFRVLKAYNLAGHGASSFVSDYRAWSGVKLTPEQLDQFDTDLAVNKPLQVEVEHRKVGKEIVPIVTGWKPAATSNQ